VREYAILSSRSSISRGCHGTRGAGHSALATRLGEITRLQVIELDKLVWRPGLAPTRREEWAAIQRRLAVQESWIMDGTRTLRRHQCPATSHGRDRVPELLAVPLCLARHPPVTRARRLLEVADPVPPPQPPGAPAGDGRTRW
jgi:hypothetical protein